MIQGPKRGLMFQSHLKDILPDDSKTSQRPHDLKVVFPLTSTVLKTKPLIHEEYARRNCSRFLLIQPGDGKGFPTTVKRSNGVRDSWKGRSQRLEWRMGILHRGQYLCLFLWYRNKNPWQKKKLKGLCWLIGLILVHHSGKFQVQELKAAGHIISQEVECYG